MGHQALGKTMEFPFESPTCANPKRKLWAGNPQGLGILAHLTTAQNTRTPRKSKFRCPSRAGARPQLATCPDMPLIFSCESSKPAPLRKESYCDPTVHSCVPHALRKTTAFWKSEMVSQSK